MANDKNDISDIVKKCKILLLDIEGTTTSISFVKDKLFPYAEENVKDFLSNEWETEDVKEVVVALRKLALEDEEKKVEGFVAIPAEDASKDDQIEGLVKNVKWQMSLDRKVGPLKTLQGLIWKKGYDKGDIKGHVYDDVSPALELWRSAEGQKVYIYSSGSVQAQKLLFGMSSAGDMLKLIDGHFDTAVGAKQEAASYNNIAEKIGCKVDEILFLTDIDKEAEAARSAGVHSALVSREGNAPLPEAVTNAFPVLYSFTELASTNKRKPDAQEEEQPAKVPKTDVETDVKTQIESEVKDATPPEKKSEETATMEVDEEVAAKVESVDGKPTSDNVERIETTVEEITESKEEADMAVCDTKPIVIESAETEMMETEPISSDVAPKANGEKEATEAKEATPVVITEIKDVTNDKEGLSEATEVIEDLVPIVEEPVAQDMEDLQNVGEVLEKECDEILSKVQDVTNLDNIPLKTLHPIAEETMETENLDSNDIVEGILDTEQELEMKKNADDKTINDMPAAKPTSDVDKAKAEDVPDKCQVIVPEDALIKIPEEKEKVPVEVKEKPSTVEAASVSEEKRVESSSVEETTEKASLTEEKLKESNATEEKVNQTSTVEEKVKETPEEKPEETSTAGVISEDCKETKEILKESSQPEKQDNNLSEKIVKKSCATEGKDSSIVEESSITKEQIKDSSCEVEKLEEKKKDVKIAEEKVEQQMETDVIKPANDSSSAVEEKKSETGEMQAECENSDSTKSPTESNAKTVTEESSMEVDQTENKVSEKVDTVSTTETVQSEKDTKETQLNGKATNGDADMVDLNGDASKDEELKSRLSMENGKEVVNGANGDSAVENKSENNGGDVKDVADIKVKTVAIDEPRNDPIEQPTEA